MAHEQAHWFNPYLPGPKTEVWSSDYKMRICKWLWNTDISLSVIENVSPFIQWILPGCFKTEPVQWSLEKAAWLWYENSRNPPTENWLPLCYESKTSRQSVYFWEDVLTSLSGSLDHVVSYPQRRMASWHERCSLFVARLMEGREVMFVLNLSSVGQLCTLRQCPLESFYTHVYWHFLPCWILLDFNQLCIQNQTEGGVGGSAWVAGA